MYICECVYVYILICVPLYVLLTRAADEDHLQKKKCSRHMFSLVCVTLHVCPYMCFYMCFLFNVRSCVIYFNVCLFLCYLLFIYVLDVYMCVWPTNEMLAKVAHQTRNNIPVSVK